VAWGGRALGRQVGGAAPVQMPKVHSASGQLATLASGGVCSSMLPGLLTLCLQLALVVVMLLFLLVLLLLLVRSMAVAKCPVCLHAQAKLTGGR